MRDGNDTILCLSGEELVAYIYDELGSPESAAFEKHLLSCGGCTAELAEVSLSRLGVYEWHRDEFMPLATPRFDIPYETAPERVSWMQMLRGLVMSPMRIGFAGVSMAAVVFGFLIANNYWQPEQPAATSIGSAPTVPDIRTVPNPKEQPAILTPNSVEKAGIVPVRVNRISRSAPAVKSVPVRVDMPKKRQPTTDSSNAANPPRLSTFVETEDRTLRLSDLVADIDTKDIK